MATVNTKKASNIQFVHIPLNTRNILSIGYANNVLEVKRRDSRVYRFFDVPEFIYLDLINPHLEVKKDRYFELMIKGHYNYHRV